MPPEYYPLVEMALVLFVVVGWGVRELLALRRMRERDAQAATDRSAASAPGEAPAQHDQERA